MLLKFQLEYDEIWFKFNMLFTNLFVSNILNAIEVIKRFHICVHAE